MDSEQLVAAIDRLGKRIVQAAETPLPAAGGGVW
jgi:hypothetical protein